VVGDLLAWRDPALRRYTSDTGYAAVRAEASAD
jgi:hypothetical protein